MELTHFNEYGKAYMVDVTTKEDSVRQAVAEGQVKMKSDTINLVTQGTMGKGDVLGVAQVAGIMGAKRTWEFIPMCHPLMLTGVNIDFVIDDSSGTINIRAVVQTTGKTGVEMEALTAVSVAALTIYDMCKAVDKGISIEYIRLAAKSGGKSGRYIRGGD